MHAIATLLTAQASCLVDLWCSVCRCDFGKCLVDCQENRIRGRRDHDDSNRNWIPHFARQIEVEPQEFEMWELVLMCSCLASLLAASSV
jgi:hypothetical protein